MKIDARRTALGLSQHGALNEDAIRSAYWRRVGRLRSGDPHELAELQQAKRALLFEVGVRTPASRRTQPRPPTEGTP